MKASSRRSGTSSPEDAAAARKTAETLGMRIHSVLFGWGNMNGGDAAAGRQRGEDGDGAAGRPGLRRRDRALRPLPDRRHARCPKPWPFDIRFDEKTGHLKQVVAGDNAKYRKYIEAHDHAVDASREGIKRLIPTAEKTGVMIAVENVWNNLWVKPELQANFVASFNSPWVRAYFDIGNHVKYAPPQDWIRALGKLLAKCHVKDFKLDRKPPRRRVLQHPRGERRLAGGAQGPGRRRLQRLDDDRRRRSFVGRKQQSGSI